jgi:hypothetical protein
MATDLTEIKEDEMDTTCSTHSGQENCIKVSGGDLNEIHQLDDLDGRITLNRILNISMLG